MVTQYDVYIIRTVDKRRLVKRLGAINETAVQNTKTIIREMLVD